jgi:hypothetical protein
MRKFYSDMRREMWRDPEYRARVTAIVAASHRTEKYRSLFSALLRERWQDPVWREKWTVAIRRRYTKTKIASVDQVVPQAEEKTVEEKAVEVIKTTSPVDTRSLARRAEEDAIAAFLASKGVTKLPGVGDPKLSEVGFLEFDKSSRKWTRSKEDLSK